MDIDTCLDGRLTTVGLGRLHFMWVKLVVEKGLEACPRVLSLASQQQTLLLLLLAGHVTAALKGHGGFFWTAESSLPAFAGPREGASTKPGTSD